MDRIWRINRYSFCTTLAFIGAWVFWRIGQNPHFVFFLLHAGICFAAGVLGTFKALVELAMFMSGRRKWRRFWSKGNKPKADDMTNVVQLRRKGLIK
ncbi:hypothetical protein [Roseibium album]|uniref:hypothetical protein n=1 Tax=Roseibium album TaxID=311410 RepID=UPI0032970E4E